MAKNLKRYEEYLNCKMNRYVAFDVETTGLDPGRGNRIIEVGAVVIQDGLIEEEFHSLVSIERPIPKAASKVHGITSEILTGQPKAKEVLPAFQQFIGKSLLVAHNADFDMGFLRWECSRTGMSLSNRCVCTLKLSKKLYPDLPDYRLETVARHVLGIEMSKKRRHRALDDARLTAQIWIAMRKI